MYEQYLSFFFEPCSDQQIFPFQTGDFSLSPLVDMVLKNSPFQSGKAIGNLDVTRIYKGKSFTSYFEDSITHAAEYTGTDSIEAELYIPF